MSEVQEPTAQTQEPAVENSTVRTLREQLRALEKSAKEQQARADALAQEKLERERAEMTEIDRLRSEREEFAAKAAIAETVKSQLDQQNQVFAGMFDAKLASVPEEYRQHVATLAASGSPIERLEKLESAMKLIPRAPIVAGTVTNPGSPAVVQPATAPPPKVTSESVAQRTWSDMIRESAHPALKHKPIVVTITNPE